MSLAVSSHPLLSRKQTLQRWCLSQGPSRKQMAHTHMGPLGEFNEELFTKYVQELRKTNWKCEVPSAWRGKRTELEPRKRSCSYRREGLPTDSATSRRVTGTIISLVARKTLGDKQAALVVILPRLPMPDSFHKPDSEAAPPMQHRMPSLRDKSRLNKVGHRSGGAHRISNTIGIAFGTCFSDPILAIPSH